MMIMTVIVGVVVGNCSSAHSLWEVKVVKGKSQEATNCLS